MQSQQWTATRWSAALLLMSVLAHPAPAQKPADVAYFEFLRVKTGAEEQFEATLKRHWRWHKKQGERWSYFVWAVDSGKREGAYQIASFGHTWAEVDESNALVSGTPSPEEDPARFHESVEESYYLFRPDLSSAPALTAPSPVASIAEVVLRPESVREFEAALKKIRAASGANPAIRARWYELATGGDWPKYLLIEDRPNWASFDDRGQLAAMMNEAYGAKAGGDFLNAFWRSIRSIYIDTLHYRPDLSRIVSSE